MALTFIRSYRLRESAFSKAHLRLPNRSGFFKQNRKLFLSGWVLIFCLCASAIAGGDDRPANVENAPVYSPKDDSWIVNAPTVITLAPGIYFIPEVGYYYMDDAAAKEQGYQWYVGVKWQLDF
jgi:hypothetical protein